MTGKNLTLEKFGADSTLNIYLCALRMRFSYCKLLMSSTESIYEFYQCQCLVVVAGNCSCNAADLLVGNCTTPEAIVFDSGQAS